MPFPHPFRSLPFLAARCFTPSCTPSWRFRGLAAALFLLTIPAALPSVARSEESDEAPRFRVHAIRADATYSASAAFDVDGDGRRDIVSGGFWYQAPDWKPHKMRDVEEIRGRFDDYSNLAWDVDQDGDLDLVSANYRSRSIYWVENQGPDRMWAKHVIAEPGPMETGRLVDVDGDGRLDLLPNGVDFAAWWSLERTGTEAKTAGTPAGAAAELRWERHALPAELAGHGIGWGDVNGDGRLDLVGTRGWAEGPSGNDPADSAAAARQVQRWTWHADFQLPRDAAIPILVHDFDRDGDADIVWARGHSTGIYWLEQTDPENAASADNETSPTAPAGTPDSRGWRKHVIDTSISQAHSLLLVDVDQDGFQDIVAGKRYLGHGGKDLGEWDPLAVYWYRYEPKRGSWSRHVVSTDPRVGFGLDPKAVDLDGDGDVDFVAAGRSGLYWIENLGPGSSEPVDTDAPDLLASSRLDPRQLMYFRAAQAAAQGEASSNKPQPVTTAAEWGLRRADILQRMQQVMGPLPGPRRRVPLELRVHRREKTDAYERIRISFRSEPAEGEMETGDLEQGNGSDGAAGDRVPAWLLVPRQLDRPAPAMLCLHQTTGIGKDEPAGLGGRPTLHYAHELASRGYVCIVPDYPSFGEYPYPFVDTIDGQYRSGSMKAIWNNVRAVDVLETLPYVDPDRIGCIGHSLGGHNSLFTAAFDLRLRAVITSCGFTAFHHYYGGNLAGWTSDRYMPRIRTRFHNSPDEVPFDFYEVLAAIAPRAIFVNAPLHDSNFDVTGVRKVMEALQPVYQLTGGRAESVQVVYPDSQHDFPDAVRQAAYEWLDRDFGRE